MRLILQSGARQVRLSSVSLCVTAVSLFVLFTYGESAVDGFIAGISGAPPSKAGGA
ncbi:hypothetical protein ACWCOP_00630 [Maricaulaceae bacterium MS644]